MKLHLAFEGGTLRNPPEEEKLRFELGACHLTGQPSQPADGKFPIRASDPAMGSSTPNFPLFRALISGR
jgi:hypothetical protein